MFKARLTSGQLGVATLRFDIYPTSWTVKRFKFKIHNQICHCRKITQRLLTNIAFTFSKLQQKGSGLAVGLSFQLSVIEREEKKKASNAKRSMSDNDEGKKKKRILIHSEVVQQICWRSPDCDAVFGDPQGWCFSITSLLLPHYSTCQHIWRSVEEYLKKNQNKTVFVGDPESKQPFSGLFMKHTDLISTNINLLWENGSFFSNVFYHFGLLRFFFSSSEHPVLFHPIRLLHRIIQISFRFHPELYCERVTSPQRLRLCVLEVIVFPGNSSLWNWASSSLNDVIPSWHNSEAIRLY